VHFPTNRWRTDSMCDYYAAARQTPGTSRIVACLCTCNEHSMHSGPYLTGVLKVGKTINLFTLTYKRKRVGPKYQGTMLFLKMLQHNVMPKRVDNFYECAANSATSVAYVRVQDLCTLLAEVKPRSMKPNMVNLVPIAHAFPVSWCVS